MKAGTLYQHAFSERRSRPLKVIGPVRSLTDIEWTVYNEILLSRDIVSAFRTAGFSGVEFQPAEVFTTTETPIGREVCELKVTGWGGMAPLESGIRVLEECPACGRRVYSGFTDPSKLFNIDAWDGSDFFIIWPMPKYILVTAAVRDFILEKDYSGVRLQPIEKFPKSISNTFTPGHLQDWFDEGKLAEIRRDEAIE